VLFADGIEQDRVELLYGHTVRLGVAEQALNLLIRA
jgi:hypothetical protein